MSEATETKDHISFQQTPDGKIVFTEPNGKTHEHLSPKIAAQIAEVEMSAAQRRLARLKSKRGIHTIECLNETFYVRELNWSQVQRVHLMASRDGNGILDIVKDDDDLRAFTMSVLESSVVMSIENDAPYFSLQDAADYCDSTDPEIKLIVGTLFNKALEVTPDLTPPKVTGATIPDRRAIAPSGDAIPPLNTASTSMTMSSTESNSNSGDSGSNLIPDSEKLVSSLVNADA